MKRAIIKKTIRLIFCYLLKVDRQNKEQPFEARSPPEVYWSIPVRTNTPRETRPIGLTINTGIEHVRRRWQNVDTIWTFLVVWSTLILFPGRFRSSFW